MCILYYCRFYPEGFNTTSDLKTPVIILAGVLTGFGTRLGSGCTSGHGVCGLSRLSLRSLIAVLTFMTSGAITAYITREIPMVRELIIAPVISHDVLEPGSIRRLLPSAIAATATILSFSSLILRYCLY